MNHTSFALCWRPLVLVVVVVGLGAANAWAQNSSLVHRDLPADQTVPTLQNSSLYYGEPQRPRELQKHDLITIRVDEISRAISEGEFDRRKIASFDALLSDWLVFDGIMSLNPAPQTQGDQRIAGSKSELYRAEAEMETLEQMSFRITASIVDIRPNGNLVLEAHKMVQNNDEIWEYRLTGICRAQDVHPGTNMVLSEDLAELNIFKRERGHVRDGYRRGWLLKGWDLIRAF